MFYLRDLITCETPIVKLQSDSSVTDEMKYEELGMKPNSTLAQKYIQMMYYMDNGWNYFKKEEKNDKFPFYLMDELMGSYLAASLSLKTINYQIGCTSGMLGLVSSNFRKVGYNYYYGNQLFPNDSLSESNLSITNIERFQAFCRNKENEERFLQHVLQLLALDLYMLQVDRAPLNIQFQLSQRTLEFDLANCYDFSKCRDKLKNEKICLRNAIVLLNNTNIQLLMKTYPQFSNYLSYLVEQGMCKTWNQICEDYHFKLNSDAYKQVFKYYKVKQESQKNLLKKLQ